MRCPACVGYTHTTRHVLILAERIEVGYLTFNFINAKFFVFIQQGYAGAVIAPVFKTAQSLYQYGVSVSFAYISNNAAHNIISRR